MKFGPVPVAQAAGKILGHNVSNLEGKRVLHKGSRLTSADVRLLTEIGCAVVYVAEVEENLFVVEKFQIV